MYGVKGATFYHALQWEAKNPGQAWSGANIRMRGKVSLLTPSMEDELSHWIAISQRQSGGVEKDAAGKGGADRNAFDESKIVIPLGITPQTLKNYTLYDMLGLAGDIGGSANAEV